MPDDVKPDDPSPNGDGPDPAADEAELIAYLDGELDPAAARRVEARLAADPKARAKAEALKKTFDLLDHLPRPEPSPTFATRTLDRLPAAKAASGSQPAPVSRSASASVPVALSASAAVGSGGRPGWWWAFGVLVAAGAALAGGYFAASAARPYFFPHPTQSKEPTSDNLPIADLRILENLPLYAAADDLDFVTKLADPEFFGDDPAVAFDPPPPAKPVEPEKPLAKPQLDQFLKAFREFPAERQAQIRHLDQQLHEKDPPTRDRLLRVLEAYAVWLDRLPEAERRGVLAAATPSLRLDAIARLREQQWRETIPEKIRNHPDPEKRAELIRQWKDDETDRRRAWAFARSHWDPKGGARPPWPFDTEAGRKEVTEFVRAAYHTDAKAGDRLRCRLTDAELARLQEAHDLGWVFYGPVVYGLSRKYETLPEPAGKPVVDPDDLWPAGRQHYEKKGNPKPRVRAASGKWPEFALEVHADLATTKLVAPPAFSFGPSRPSEYREPVREVLHLLEKKAKREEWERLRGLEGKWPDHSRELLKLAERYDLSVPGAMLPGPPSRWRSTYDPGRPAPPKPAGE